MLDRDLCSTTRQGRMPGTETTTRHSPTGVRQRSPRVAHVRCMHLCLPAANRSRMPSDAQECRLPTDATDGRDRCVFRARVVGDKAMATPSVAQGYGNRCCRQFWLPGSDPRPEDGDENGHENGDGDGHGAGHTTTLRRRSRNTTVDSTRHTPTATTTRDRIRRHRAGRFRADGETLALPYPTSPLLTSL